MGCITTKPRKELPGQRPERRPVQEEERRVQEEEQKVERRVYSPREPVVESPRSSLQIVPASEMNKIIVRTKFTVEDVKYCDVTPHSTARMDFRYNCPICMKYLSSILITTCCRNYFCHFCLAEYQSRELRFQICCPMCNAEPLMLEDVNPTADVKKYSDSPYSTYKNSSQTETKWVSKLAIVQEDEQLARELEEGHEFSQQADLNERDPALIGFSSTT